MGYYDKTMENPETTLQTQINTWPSSNKAAPLFN